VSNLSLFTWRVDSKRQRAKAAQFPDVTFTIFGWLKPVIIGQLGF
jgi:hypothetical protein